MRPKKEKEAGKSPRKTTDAKSEKAERDAPMGEKEAKTDKTTRSTVALLLQSSEPKKRARTNF